MQRSNARPRHCGRPNPARAYAKAEAHRYEQLLTKKLASDEMVAGKRQELKIADAALEAAREDLARSRHDHEALVAQRDNLRLVAPVDGLVVAREADPGTTMVAGQAVIQLIDPASLWINARFDQISASGLTAELPAAVMLRSRGGQTLPAGCCAWSPWPTRSPKRPWPRSYSSSCRNRCHRWASWPKSPWSCQRCPPRR